MVISKLYNVWFALYDFPIEGEVYPVRDDVNFAIERTEIRAVACLQCWCLEVREKRLELIRIKRLAKLATRSLPLPRTRRPLCSVSDF